MGVSIPLQNSVTTNRDFQVTIGLGSWDAEKLLSTAKKCLLAGRSRDRYDDTMLIACKVVCDADTFCRCEKSVSVGGMWTVLTSKILV